MPQLRQPRTLKDISVQMYVNLYCGACEKWISQLYAAAKSSSSDYSSISRSVEAECQQIKRSLSDLPYSLLEIISPQLTRKFEYMIYDYHRNTRSFKFILPNIKLFIKVHNSLCTAMFRSVLTPYLYKHDDFGFTENVVLQTLDSVSGLRTLRLMTKESLVVERMLPHLTNLEVFSYHYTALTK
jgi:hypothetical protein